MNMDTYPHPHILHREIKTHTHTKNRKEREEIKSGGMAADCWVHRIKVSSQEQKGLSSVLCGVS